MINMPQTTRRTTQRAGFTLLELTMSLAILALLLGAVASMMSLSARAIPKETDSDQKVSTLRQRLGDVCNDLSLAKSISAVTPTSITLVVPDRDNDGSDETIEYRWSGSTGDAFARTDASASDVAMISGVDSLSITLTQESRQRTITSGTTDRSEKLLCAYTGDSSGATTIDSTTRIGLCIVPNLSSDVTDWQLTRLRYQINAFLGSSYTHRLKFHSATSQGWVDESTVLATIDVPGVVATSDQSLWMDVATTGLPWTTASESLWVVLGTQTSVAAKYDVPYGTAGHMCYTDGRTRVVALDVWANGSRDKVLLFEAYGKTRTPATAVQTYKVATRAQIAVRLSTGEQAALSTRLWNQPEVP